MQPYADVVNEVEYIAATVPVFKYWDDEGNALLLGTDMSFVVMVTHQEGPTTPTVQTAYTSRIPLREFSAGNEYEEYEGFEPGFTT